MHSNRFPNETAAYRKARNELLEVEQELRRRTEQVAVMRRALPLGGEIPVDYVFQEAVVGSDGSERARPVRMSELFAPDKPTLAIYSFMFGPAMSRPCPLCTSILDSLDGAHVHASQLINLAVVAKSPIERLREFACERGWRHLRLLSSAANTYNRDYHAEDEQGGEQWPALTVFTRRDGRIHHATSSELFYVPPDSGQDPRHVDMIWPLWNLLDQTPEGRGRNFNPKLEYEPATLIRLP
jgi:predicted dithiol-disulfide oxidoreductase (DUF899 family)